MTRTDIETYFADRGHAVSYMEFQNSTLVLAILDEHVPETFGEGIMNRTGATHEDAARELYDYYVSRNERNGSLLAWLCG